MPTATSWLPLVGKSLPFIAPPLASAGAPPIEWMPNIGGPMPYEARQLGVSLVEVLIAVLIFSIGLIGLAGLMVVATRSNHVAYLRTQATFLANNMAERMSANPAAIWAGNYNSTGYPVASATVGCGSGAPCPAASVAAHDQQMFSRQLRTFLPNPTATIACSGPGSVAFNPSGYIQQRPPYGGNCAMTINWTEQGGGDKAHSEASVQTFAWNFQP